MLFAVSWSARENASEERDRRTLTLFKGWQPPAGFEFKGFYDYVDGDGGIAIVETSSAEAMLEALAPWATFFRITARAILPSETSTPIVERVLTWRESIR